MAKDHQALHFREAAEPGAESENGGVVDCAIAGERRYRRWHKASEIERFHLVFLFAKGAGGSLYGGVRYIGRAIQVFQIYNLGMATKGSMDPGAWRLFIDAV